MTERDYYLGFSSFPGIGPIKFSVILKTFGSAKDAWNAREKELEQILKSLAPKFIKFRNSFEIDEFQTQLKKQKISFVTLDDNEYPQLLRKIKNPPIILYIKGNKKALSEKPLVAVVGTRKITSYGRAVTEMFSFELASSGLAIVSGMALGVDGVAHKAAIEAKGTTIAVLGNGVDLPYPKENERLYEEILDSGGAVLSEFPPSEPPSMGSFPSRNRIVAGLSLGVLVTEGASDSGSLITANFGLEFGRKVFAVPGPITSSLSAAPLKLIEKGAKLVITPEDVIRELGVKVQTKEEKKKFKDASSEEFKILQLIENEPLHFDEIARRLDMETAKLGTLLSIMEVKGLLKSSGGNYSII